MKRVLATQIKGTVILAFWLAFTSEASAVLRPLFPIKPLAPSNGELIVIGDELRVADTKSLYCITRARDASHGLDNPVWLSQPYHQLYSRHILTTGL
jgi:hypothetical protein